MTNSKFKTALNIFHVSFLYFFVNGFAVLFLLNLFLRELVWPFFSGLFLISFVNLIFSVVAIYLSIKISAPFLLKEVKKGQERSVFYLTSSLFLLFVLVTDYYVMRSVDTEAMIVQAIYSFSLIGIFLFLSYNIIIRNNKEL